MPAALIPGPPYSTLTAQVAALLIAIVVLAWLWPGAPLRARLAPAAAIVALVVACMGALPQLDSQARVLERSREQGVGQAAAQSRCIRDAGHAGAEPFFRWAQDRMRPGDRFYLAGPAAIDHACLIFTLLPGVPVVDPERADYWVYFGGVPGGYAERIAAGQAIEFDARNGLIRPR